MLKLLALVVASGTAMVLVRRAVVSRAVGTPGTWPAVPRKAQG